MLALSVVLPSMAVTPDSGEDWVAIMGGRSLELARTSTMLQQDLAPLADFLSLIDSPKGPTVARIRMVSSSSVSKALLRTH